MGASGHQNSHEIFKGLTREVSRTETFGVCLYVRYMLCQSNHGCCSGGNKLWRLESSEWFPNPAARNLLEKACHVPGACGIGPQAQDPTRYNPGPNISHSKGLFLSLFSVPQLAMPLALKKALIIKNTCVGFNVVGIQLLKKEAMEDKMRVNTIFQHSLVAMDAFVKDEVSNQTSEEANEIEV